MDSSHMIDKDDEDIKINDFVLHSEDLTQLLNDYDKYLHKYTESLLPRLQPSDNPHNPFGSRGQKARTLGRAVTNLPDATFVLIASNFGQLCKIDIQLGMLESFQRLASSFFCVHRGSTEELQRYYYALRNVKAGTGEDTRLHTLYNFLTASGIIKSNTIKEISLVSLFLEFFDFLEFDDFRQSLVFFASFDSNSSLGNDGCLVSPSPFVSCVVPVLFLIGFDPNVIPLIRSAFGPISQSLRLSSTPLITPQRAQINANPAFPSSSSSSSSSSTSLLTQDVYSNDLLSPPLLQQQQQQQPRPHQQLSSFSAGKYPHDLYGNDLLSPPLQQQQQSQQRMDQQYDDGSWDGSLFGQNVVSDEGECVDAVGNGAVIGPSFVYQQNCAYQTASSPQASLLRPTVQGGNLMQQQQRQMAAMDMGGGGAPFVIGNDDGAYDSVTIEDNTFGSPSTMGTITATPGAIAQDDYYGAGTMDGAGIDYRKHTQQQQQQHGRHHHHHHNHTYVTVKTEKIDDYPSQNVAQAPEVPSSSGSYGYPLYYSVDSGKPQQIYYPDNAKLASSPSLTKPQVLSSLPPMAATTGTAQAQTPQPVSLDYPQYFQSNIAIPTSAAPSVANTSTLSTSAPSTSTPALMMSLRQQQQQQKMNTVSSPPEAFATAANPVPTLSQPTNIMATQHSIMQSKSTSNLHAKGRSKYGAKSHKQQQQQGLMLSTTQPPPPPIPLQSIPIKAETYDSLSASMANININSTSSATTTTTATTATTIPSVTPNNGAASINNNNSNSISNSVNTSVNDSDSSNMFGKVSLHISKQPPSKTVYQRILKPYPTVMVCGLENTGLANLFVEAILLRADNEIDARSCMEGTVVVKVSNSFAVFKKLKILTTSQQQGTLFKLRFILKSYYGSDFRAIPNTETTSNTIEVFSHTLYLNHDRSQQQVNPSPTSVTSPPTASTSPSTSIIAANGGSIQSMTSSTSSLPAVVSPSPTSSLSSPSSLPLNPLLRHSKQQNQNQKSAGGYYDVEKNGSPVVKMVIPQCCRAGERVVVIGSNFCNSGNTKVSFNDVAVVPSFHESGTLICTVPRLVFKSLDTVNQNEMQVSVRVSNDSITFSDSVFTIIYYNDQ